MTLQISITSKYAPIRLWRVRYSLRDSCYSPNGDPQCAPDVALGYSLQSRDIPFRYGYLPASACTGTFDLWVESMEYFDDLNVAVTVRRGGVGAIMSLYFGEGDASDNVGTSVTYFVNALDASMVREGAPWLAPDAFPKVIAGSAVLCPAMRLLPSVGTFLFESLASAALLFRTPLMVLANPFAVMELLASRSIGCPENALAHGALADCGAALFSLDDFYDSVDTASGSVLSLAAA